MASHIAAAASGTQPRSTGHGIGPQVQVPPAFATLASSSGSLVPVPTELQPPPAAQPSPATGTASLFSQIHALRNTASEARSSRRRDEREQAAASHSSLSAEPDLTSARTFQGFVSTCAVCLADFAPQDHVCRLSCGHVYHCLCIGEMAVHMGASVNEEGSLSFVCPSCRVEGQVVRSWHYPQLPAQPDSANPEELEANSLPATPTGPRGQTAASEASPDRDEFRTPDSSHFPWWPVASHEEQADPAVPSQASFHSSVKLANGRVGLLVDPGSYGNLVGEDWLANAASRMGRNPKVTHRASALQVGGVGRGAQQCLVDCNLPIALRRQDGSTATGSYTSPVVSQSGCPALLGLRTLQGNKAILDCHTKMLHFPAEGEVTLVLPPGSESFQLESAESGHLLLPCDAFEHVSQDAVQGEHHLFADGPGISEASEVAEADLHLATDVTSADLVSEEEMCAEVLASYSFDSAAQVLCNLVSSWIRSGVPSRERFQDHDGFSKCLGLFTHGGIVGASNFTQRQPKT